MTAEAAEAYRGFVRLVLAEGGCATGDASEESRMVGWLQARLLPALHPSPYGTPDTLRRQRNQRLNANPTLPPSRTKWTRRVPHPVLIGHAASLTPY